MTSTPSTPVAARHDLPAAAPFVGRADAHARLSAAWADRQTGVIAVCGAAGVGKTALVRHWLGHGGPGDARVFVWCFAARGVAPARFTPADAFIDALGAWLALPPLDDRDPCRDADRLADALGGARTALILDGFVPALPVRDGRAAVADPVLARLLDRLAADIDGLCIVTTPAPFTPQTAGFDELTLSGLPRADGVRLLRARGADADDATLAEAIDAADGHPLTLALLGAALARGARPARSGALTVERAIELLDHRLDPTARRALRLWSVLDPPATPSPEPALLDALLTGPPIADLTDGLTDGAGGAAWTRAVEALEAAGLAQHGALLGVVRDVVRARLAADDPFASQTAHGRAFDHLCAVTPEHPDGRVALDPLYRAVMHGCAAGRWRAAQRDVYFLRIQRGNRNYAAYELGTYAADLAALSHLFDAPFTDPARDLSPRIRGWLLGEASYALGALGRIDEAHAPATAELELQRARAAAAEEAVDALGVVDREAEWDALDAVRSAWDSVAAAAHTLCELRADRGHLDGPEGAIACGWQAIDAVSRSRAALEQMGALGYTFDLYCDHDRDTEYRRMAALTGVADALHARGRQAAAARVYLEAERVQAARQPSMPRLYARQGCRYAMFLAPTHPEDARERIEWIAALAERHRQPRDMPWAHLARARTAEDPAAARAAADRAITDWRRARDRRWLPAALLARAAAHRRLGDLDAAATDLAEARHITERGGMRLALADVLIESTHLALARRADAEHAFAAACALVHTLRAHRRDPDLRALAAALGHPPPPWLDTSDVDVPLPVDASDGVETAEG